MHQMKLTKQAAAANLNKAIRLKQRKA